MPILPAADILGGKIQNAIVHERHVFEKHRIGDRKDGCIRADAERQRDHGHRGEP